MDLSDDVRGERVGRPVDAYGEAGGPAKAWRRADTIAIVAITLLAALVRGFHATSPHALVFDEAYYVRDACLYLHGAGACGFTSELSATHPPLGKWLIAISIAVFGNRAGAWRAPSLMAGTMSVAVLYLLARRLLRSTLAASVASSLLAVDFLHIVLSRTAMLDMFVTAFALSAVLFVVYDRDSAAAGTARRHTLRSRPWRLASGVAAGAATASKWSGLPFLVAVLLLAFGWEVRARKAGGEQHAIGRSLSEEGRSIAVALVIVPALVYLASYAGRLHGSLVEWPWGDGAWLRAFVVRQANMLRFQARLGQLAGSVSYSSPAWSWPLLRRPVAFFFRSSSGSYSEILAFGNPIVWWPSCLALVAVAFQALRRRLRRDASTVALAGFMAGWLPWALISTGRSYGFLYYLLPATPFMCLGVGIVVVDLAARVRSAALVALGAATVASFLFFHPLLVGDPLRPPAWHARLVFEDCDGRLERPLTPYVMIRERRVPRGWCWV